MSEVGTGLDGGEPQTPVEFGSLTQLYIVLAISIIAIVAIGVDVASYSMLEVSGDPWPWLWYSSLILLTLSLVVIVITWRMRTRLLFTEPEWRFEERELAPTEYEALVREYARHYLHISVGFDWQSFFLAVVMLVLSLAVPFILLGVSVYWLRAGPLLFGVAAVIYGLALSRFVYRLVSTEASGSFPICLLYTSPSPRD